MKIEEYAFAEETLVAALVYCLFFIGNIRIPAAVKPARLEADNSKFSSMKRNYSEHQVSDVPHLDDEDDDTVGILK